MFQKRFNKQLFGYERQLLLRMIAFMIKLFNDDGRKSNSHTVVFDKKMNLTETFY